MRLPATGSGSTPRFLSQARELAHYVAGRSDAAIAKAMGISPALAATTLETMRAWDAGGAPAIDSFVGDIYSGLRAGSLTDADRAYASNCLVILSGLYGVLRPLDAVRPYRLEMAYKFPDAPFDNLYKFWGDSLALALPASRTIINTSSAEYTKAVFSYVPDARIITPKFLTVSPKTGVPTFVTVHAKIARGAFARWLIISRIEDETRLKDFADLGYAYDAVASTELEPVYVAHEFQGLGLSVRLT